MNGERARPQKEASEPSKIPWRATVAQLPVRPYRRVNLSKCLIRSSGGSRAKNPIKIKKAFIANHIFRDS